MKGAMKKGAFTLVEIMIVVTIIAMLSAIAIPSYVRSRRSAQIEGCINNLFQIDGSKDRWALENMKVDGDEVTMAEIIPYFLKKYAPCPAGGSYVVNPVGQDPICTIGAEHTF